MTPSTGQTAQPRLRRAITLPLLLLYGLGVTIGAGIYVLIGETAARAGLYAPVSFLLAAFVMSFTAASFCELSGRHPRAGGDAVYVEAGFGWPMLTTATGLLLVIEAMISSSAITLGSAGYIATLLPLPTPWIVAGVIAVAASIAAWGILESVTFAAILTLIEISGLLTIIVAGLWIHPDILNRLHEVIPPPTDTAALSGVFLASLLAFFAFIGFEDMVNIVEETKQPSRNMPIGILLTLAITTVIYFLVVTVAVLVLPMEDLVGSRAPISLLFERLTGISPLAITLIAIGATLNGIVIQMILASRVMYGLAKVGRMPALFTRLNARTRTPLIATFAMAACTLILSLFFPIAVLAERTTQIVLVVFGLVNLSLIVMKLRKDAAPPGTIQVPLILPVLGLLGCLAMLIGPLLIVI